MRIMGFRGEPGRLLEIRQPWSPISQMRKLRSRGPHDWQGHTANSPKVTSVFLFSTLLHKPFCWAKKMTRAGRETRNIN